LARAQFVKVHERGCGRNTADTTPTIVTTNTIGNIGKASSVKLPNANGVIC
jgi:hypothetical protein